MNSSPNSIVTIPHPRGESLQVGVSGELVVFAGPCVIESKESFFRHCDGLVNISRETGVEIVLKASYDKANRTSISSFRGPGLEEGLKILEEARKEFAFPVITDVHSPEEVRSAQQVVDVLQVPAFLCRQTDLLLAVGGSGKPVLVKKGQFVHPEDMNCVLEKILAGGNREIMLCERGSTFGYRELIVDFKSLPIMSSLGVPVVFDATHSVQVMSGAGGVSGGRREFVAGLARAAVAMGVDALFIEVHESPDEALSDGPNMLPMCKLSDLLVDLQRLKEVCSDSVSKESQ